MELTSIYKKHFFLPNVNLNKTSDSDYSIASVDYFSEFVDKAKKNINPTKNIVWICQKCGHTHIGTTAPSICPICNSTYESK
ncbi:MAG: rubrerythrin family protein [Clostridia bacterium]|nr:rubrerythrin family protein [Clostridia bacterium]